MQREIVFDALSEAITTRITLDEKLKLDAVSKQYNISISELVRNLIRENLYKYAISENLAKNLLLSGQIDALLLEWRLISKRKATNLSKIREILTDFEMDLEESTKKIDYVSLDNSRRRINIVLESIYKNDEWLAQQIDGQVRRILKSKHIRYLLKLERASNR